MAKQNKYAFINDQKMNKLMNRFFKCVTMHDIISSFVLVFKTGTCFITLVVNSTFAS